MQQQDIYNILTQLVDLDGLGALAWNVKGPGLLIIFVLVLRAVKSFFTFSPIKLVMSLVYAFIVLVILSNFGQQIEQAFAPKEDPNSPQTTTTGRTDPG